jgi:hypothetical protein
LGVVKILENIDLDWWKNNCYELSLDQSLGEQSTFTIKVSSNTFYEINNAVIEMEKIKMESTGINGDFLKLFTSTPFCISSNVPFYFASNKKKEENTMKNLQVKSIKYDERYTTVTWFDDTKTRVSCGKEDEYNRYNAFCSALAKKIFGTSSHVRKIVETKDEALEIAKRREELKEKERLAQIARDRKVRHQIKHRAKQIVIEEKAKKLAEQILESK